jgi:hypothetical protein
MDEIGHRKDIFVQQGLGGDSPTRFGMCWFKEAQMGQPEFFVRRKLTVCAHCPKLEVKKRRYHCEAYRKAHGNGEHDVGQVKYDLRAAPRDCPYMVEMVVLTQKGAHRHEGNDSGRTGPVLQPEQVSKLRPVAVP